MSLSVAVLLPGDFNVDDVVNAADYVVWRKTIGTQEAYNTWQAQFGETAGSGSALGPASPAAVPESSVLGLAISGISAILAIGRRRRIARSCAASAQ